MSEHSAGLHTNTEPARNRCVRLLCLLLLLGLTLASAAINRLVPKDPNGVQGTNVRVGWYLRSGQWHADIRTLAAAFHYLMTPDTNPPTDANSPANQLATASQPGSHAPSINEVKGGHNCLPNECPPHRGDSSSI